jgi:DNA-binding transcriptional ArsR family regulator
MPPVTNGAKLRRIAAQRKTGTRLGTNSAGAAQIYSTKWLTVEIADCIFNHMVELDSPRLDAVFHALGDPTRRQMLRHLAEGEQTVGQLAQPFAISLAAASKHIKALEGAGLIRREVRGRSHICRLDPGPLASADEWLRYYERFWTGRLDALEQLLRDEIGAHGRPGDARAPLARKARTRKQVKKGDSQ